MSDSELVAKFEKVRTLLRGGDLEDAEEVLQECIDRARVSTREFMEGLLDEFPEREIRSMLARLYWWNYI
jgi:acetyl-CoA carboxylase beta subunit